MPTGASRRRGPFVEGESVQLTDMRGRLATIVLEAGKSFHTHRGYIRHDDLIGRPDGIVVTNTRGSEYLALRPLLSDYVMSMPRGAQIVYPKDSAMIVQMADIFPGATVVEAGVGSGALSMSLLQAVGDRGRLLSFERREEFAEIAAANAKNFFGQEHPAWTITLGDLVEQLPRAVEPGTVDRMVLDMLAPWECLQVAADALAPGGVLICYVATTTQLSRVAEGAREMNCFTEPDAFESLVRGWHLEGLAVRPEHRMHAHSGFLVRMRRMAPGITPPLRKRRPKGHIDDVSLTEEDFGERMATDKRLRKISREARRQPFVQETREQRAARAEAEAQVDLDLNHEEPLAEDAPATQVVARDAAGEEQP